jgi:cellulose biosynthesis protein BcsQ
VKRMISRRDMRSELVLSEALENLRGYDFVLVDNQVQRYREGLRVRSIIPTFCDGRVRKSAEILEQLERHFPDALWPCVRYNSKLSEAPGFGQHNFEYSKRSNGAADYARLAERLVKGR